MAHPTPPVCLEITHLSKYFRKRCVLKDISFSVKEQEIVGVIGPNGAGKTTLFNIITGVLPPDGGSITFHGQNLAGWPPHRICHAGIARASQIPTPFPEMTALENVLMGLMFGKGEPVPPAAKRDEARELLALVGLLPKEGAVAQGLTLIEKLRLEVARALATRPHLLLLDEIAAGLSPGAVKQTVWLIETLRNQGLTLLITDHFLNLTLRVSDRVLALDRGEIIVEGLPQEVVRHPEVASAYLGTREEQVEGDLPS